MGLSEEDKKVVAVSIISNIITMLMQEDDVIRLAKKCNMGLRETLEDRVEAMETIALVMSTSIKSISILEAEDIATQEIDRVLETMKGPTIQMICDRLKIMMSQYREEKLKAAWGRT